MNFGAREHATAAISNGLAAYGSDCIIPITSTFLMFSSYASAAIRMGALQKLHVIHVLTDDSIWLGSLGPTQQPVEHAALCRSKPNMLFIRPGGSEETAGAWIVAMEANRTPSIISLSSQPLRQLSGSTRRADVAKRAYILRETDSKLDDPEVIIIGVG